MRVSFAVTNNISIINKATNRTYIDQEKAKQNHNTLKLSTAVRLGSLFNVGFRTVVQQEPLEPDSNFV